MALDRDSGVQTDPFTERIALLLEEAAEVVQACGKILRHGPFSRNPLDVNGPSNIGELERELGNLHAAKNLLVKAGDIGTAATSRFCEEKLEQLPEWLHTEENRRLVDEILAEA